MSEQDLVAVGSIATGVTAVFTAAMAIAVIVTAIYARGTLRAAKVPFKCSPGVRAVWARARSGARG